MTIYPSPLQVVGESLLAFWRQTPELQVRFPDTHYGAAAYSAFVQDAVRERLANTKKG